MPKSDDSLISLSIGTPWHTSETTPLTSHPFISFYSLVDRWKKEVREWGIKGSRNRQQAIASQLPNLSIILFIIKALACPFGKIGSMVGTFSGGIEGFWKNWMIWWEHFLCRFGGKNDASNVRDFRPISLARSVYIKSCLGYWQTIEGF